MAVAVTVIKRLKGMASFDLRQCHGTSTGFLRATNCHNVHFWPLADIASCAAHVCFQGQSGHGFLHCICPLLTQSGHWRSQFNTPYTPFDLDFGDVDTHIHLITGQFCIGASVAERRDRAPALKGGAHAHSNLPAIRALLRLNRASALCQVR